MYDESDISFTNLVSLMNLQRNHFGIISPIVGDNVVTLRPFYLYFLLNTEGDLMRVETFI